MSLDRFKVVLGYPAAAHHRKSYFTSNNSMRNQMHKESRLYKFLAESLREIGGSEPPKMGNFRFPGPYQP